MNKYIAPIKTNKIKTWKGHNRTKCRSRYEGMTVFLLIHTLYIRYDLTITFHSMMWINKDFSYKIQVKYILFSSFNFYIIFRNPQSQYL